MSSSSVHPPPAGAPQNPERWETIDLTFAKALVGLILRAPKRHPRLAILTLVVGLLVSAAAIAFAPRTYRVEARILAQRNLVIPLLGNPRRPVPADYDTPARAASELVLQHDNLVAIVDELDLLRKWNEQRPPILKVKDAVMDAVRGPVSDEDMRRAMVGLLEKKLAVRSDGTTLRISAEWGHPETTYEIVSIAQRNFLDRRSALELGVIVDTITILDEEAKKHEAALAAALAEVQRLKPALPAPPTLSATPAAPATPATPVRPKASYAAPRSPAASDGNLARELADKRRAIRELDEPRQRRLAELNARLEDLRGVYTPAHPIIAELEARIREASAESPELKTLREEEAELTTRLAAESLQPSVPRVIPQRASRGASAPIAPTAPGALQQPEAPIFLVEDESPELEAARGKLASALRKYDDVMNRIDSAQIEIHTGKAAFKYRYMSIMPPEIPSKPVRPSVISLAVGGVFLSVVLAIFAAAARDFTSGRFVEAWQVRRRLRIPLLAEVPSP